MKPSILLTVTVFGEVCQVLSNTINCYFLLHGVGSQHPSSSKLILSSPESHSCLVQRGKFDTKVCQ
jgi:hypothetical protein